MSNDILKIRMFYAALGILLACIIYFFCITFGTVPESGKRYADIILGALIGSGFTGIISFYYGSSKSSDDKNKTIDTQIQNAVDVAKDKPS